MKQPVLSEMFVERGHAVPQPPASPARQEQARLNAASERVLARLQAGPATNVQLNEICFRYGARIFELKKKGHVITKEHVADGVYRYELRA